MARQHPLTELHRGTEFFLCLGMVLSTEENMPWHGDLRAETVIFLTIELEDRSFY